MKGLPLKRLLSERINQLSADLARHRLLPVDAWHLNDFQGQIGHGDFM
jgi:hypothetical protein